MDTHQSFVKSVQYENIQNIVLFTSKNT